MNTNIKLLALAAGSFTIVGFAANDYFKTVRREKIARAKIAQDALLYALAASAAQVRMEEKLSRSDYRPNVFDLANDFHNEVAFETIAILYDK